MAHLFVSYSSRDAVFARLLSLELQRRGVDVWVDSGELRGGDEWRSSIDSGISACPVTVVILSRNSCNSSYVTYEWAHAIGAGKKIIPILIDDTGSDWVIHPRLEVLQYMNFTTQPNGPWDQLAEDILSYAGRNSSDTRVTELTVAQLTEAMAASIALASAQAKSSNRIAGTQDYHIAAESVAEVLAMGQPIQRRILWVDDRPANNSLERKMFEELGIIFDIARSTKEALRMLKGNVYAAIISDMGRVEGPREGYVLLEKVRADGIKTPFFIYAGSNQPRHKLETQERGGQGTTNIPSELLQMVMAAVSN